MEAASALEANSSCKNCGEFLHGEFCSACGQRHIPKRLSAKELVINAFFSLIDIDSKILRTIRELTINPGQVALNYISGRRFSYVNPIKYFLATSAFALTAIALTIGLENVANEMVHVGEEIDPNDLVFQAADALKAVLREHLNLISFLTLPIFAFFLRWQYWWAQKNYAEVLSFLAFVMGQAQLYSIAVTLVLAVLGSAEQGISTLIGYAVLIQGAKVFFDMSWVKSLFAVIVSILLQGLASVSVGAALTFAKMSGLI